MQKSMILAAFLLFLIGNNAFAGIFYGFGIGYTIKNIYEDSTGVLEEESNVPLVDLSMGYQRIVNVVAFNLDANIQFYAMDFLRGNREYILFAEPRGYVFAPLKINELGISPVVGYGGMLRNRYIKERVYLSGEDRYVNPADFSESNFDILYGGTLQYSDWVDISFLILRDIDSHKSLCARFRTPHSARSAPYISIEYAGGSASQTIALGLTFWR